MRTYDYLMGRKTPAAGNVADNAAQANRALAGGAQPATPQASAPTPATPANDEKEVNESNDDYKARKAAAAEVINEDAAGTKRIENPASQIVGQPRPYTTLPQQPATVQKPRLTYEDMINRLYPEMAEKKRQEGDERLRRKRKREAVISAIGDGISALANLGATARYATPFDVSSNTMSRRTQERYDKIKAEREKRLDAYRAAVARARDLDMAQREKNELLAEKRRQNAADAEWEREKFERTQEQRRDEMNRLYGYRYAGLQQKSEQFLKKMEQDWQKAKLSAETRRYATDHRNSGGGGSGQKKKYSLYNPQTGQTEYFENKDSWQARYFETHPDETPVTTPYTTTHTDSRGRTSTTEGTRSGNVAAQIGHGQARDKAAAKAAKTSGKSKATQAKKKTIPGYKK